MELSIAFLIGLSCFIGLILLYLKREFSDYVRTIDLIPGPKKTPVLGNITYVAPWKNSGNLNARMQHHLYLRHWIAQI